MSKVAYLTDDSHHIVFSCEDPSMLLMYDSVMGVHSIWNIRRAKPEVQHILPFTLVFSHSVKNTNYN